MQLVKRYFKIRDDSGIERSKKLSHSKEFKKTVSFLKCNPFLQLIQYIGNENVYKPRVHGNTKHNTNSEYIRTAPSIIKEIGKKLESGTSVSNTYTSMVQKCNKSSVQGVLNPRNREQVRNIQKQILRNQRISMDDIYNLYALALELDNFGKLIFFLILIV